MVKRLIVPLDQSTLSESALPLARGLARQLNLPVSLLSVVDAPASLQRASANPRVTAPEERRHDHPAEPLMPSAGPSNASMSSRDLDKLAERVSESERYLRGVAETFEDVIVDTEVVYGDPAERILTFGDTRTDPAFIIASHGRSGVARMLLGSVTARVVQSTNRPVFVVRGTEASNDKGEHRVEKLLVPLDGSTFSNHALATVDRIFGSSTLTMHLLRVEETQRSRGAYEYSMNEEYMQQARQDVDAQLAETANQLRDRGHSVTIEFSQGRVAEQVNAFAESLSVDLIAMATHGSNADMRRFVLGSVAEQVLHEASKPLLLVRPEA